jgi:hypothetical protein
MNFILQTLQLQIQVCFRLTSTDGEPSGWVFMIHTFQSFNFSSHSFIIAYIFRLISHSFIVMLTKLFKPQRLRTLSNTNFATIIISFQVVNIKELVQIQCFSFL